MASTNSTQFAKFFGSTPRHIRELLHSALQLRDLDELSERARSCSCTTLSRAVLDLLNVRVDIPDKHRERFPRTGAVVVVANHPFGFLDGLVLDVVLQELRPDIKILSNSLLWGIEEMHDRCLPVDVFGGGLNLRPVRQALQLLAEGRGIAIFPAGEVAHWRSEQRAVTDPPWNDIAARIALKTEARVVPIYFAGANSLAFQIAGLVHARLRTARVAAELFNTRFAGCGQNRNVDRSDRTGKAGIDRARDAVSSTTHLHIESSLDRRPAVPAG